MVPLILKKKFILWSTGGGWETPPARVCLQNGRVAVWASLALSLSTFQPIIFRGEGAPSVIALKPTQPLMLFSCHRSRLTQDLDSRSTSSSRFYFCKDTLTSPVFRCSHSCIMTASGRVWPRQRAAQHNCSAENHRSLFPGKLTAQPNLQHSKEPYLPTLINQVTVSFT